MARRKASQPGTKVAVSTDTLIFASTPGTTTIILTNPDATNDVWLTFDDTQAAVVGNGVLLAHGSVFIIGGAMIDDWDGGIRGIATSGTVQVGVTAW